MKKLVSILIAGSMAASLIPCTAFAATGAFTYTETFDTPSAGLPAGWTIYTPRTAANTTASVSDGALTLTNTSADNGEWILFDSLSDVSNNKLTMECDITYIGNEQGNSNSVAGLAYMIDTGTSGTTQIDDTYTSSKDTAFTGFKGSYAALYTDSEYSDQQVEDRREKADRRGDCFYVPRNATNDAKSGVKPVNQNEGKAVHLKIYYDNVSYDPMIYIDNVELVRNTSAGFADMKSMSGDWIKSGKVGLYIRNTSVKIDNLKISGTGTYPDTTTYKAAFNNPGSKYSTIDDAIADVKVSKCDVFGNSKTDVTSSAVITGTDNGDGTGTISVSYDSYTTTLNCQLVHMVQRSFVYEENFDGIANGQLPEGWKLYSRVGTAKTQAAVTDGALNFKSNSSSGYEWLLFDNLSYVDVDNLTMECDITYQTNGANYAQDQGAAGFGYAVKVTDSAASEYTTSNLKGSFAALYTDKTDQTYQQAVIRRYKKAKADGSQAESFEDNDYNASDVTAMNQNDGQPIHLKVAFDKASGTMYYPPKVFINGTEINDRSGLGSDRYLTNGKVGLYLKHSNVLIDNIKITGTRKAEIVDTDSITIGTSSYNSTDKTLTIPVTASLASAASGKANSAVIAAVYDESDKITSANIVNIDTAKFVDYMGAVTLKNVNAQPAAGKTKVFLWDMNEVDPLIPARSN